MKKNIFTVYFLFAFYIKLISPNTNETHEIKELNADNFNSTLENSNIFIEFYTQWCGHCRALDKVILETSNHFKGKNITFAKIDVGLPQNKEIATLYNVDSFPTFFFITEGQQIFYKGKKTFKGFKKYLTNELNTDLTQYELKTNLININSLSSEKKGILLFIGDNFKNLKMFNVYRRISESFKGKLIYLWTESNEFFNKFHIKSHDYGLVYFNYLVNEKKYNEGYSIDLKSNLDVKTRIKMFFSPIFNEITVKNLGKIVDSGIPALYLVYEGDGKSENINSPLNQLIYKLTSIAEKYKGDLVFYKMDFKDKLLAPFYDNFSFKEKSFPSLIILDNSPDDDIVKYLLDKEFSVENFVKFVEDFRKNALIKYFTSEDLPLEPVNKFGVMKVVRKSLNQTILNNNNDEIIMLFCDGNVKNCEVVRQRFYAIKAKFANSTNLIFAEYDAKLNENDVIEINFVPEIIYLPAKSEGKLTELKRFVGNFTSIEIIEFLQQNLNKENISFSPNTDVEENIFRSESQIISKKIDAEEQDEKVKEDTEDDAEEGEEESEDEPEPDEKNIKDGEVEVQNKTDL